MDILSRLLLLMPASGTLDIRCHFSPPWRLDYAASGPREIPYHILLRGTAQVDDGEHPVLFMQAGDILLIPSGVSHVLYEGGRALSTTGKSHRERGLRIITNESDAKPVNMLCGRFILPLSPRQMIKDNLPRQLIIRGICDPNNFTHSTEEQVARTRLARLVTLMHEEAIEHSSGSESIINHLSGALFGMTLRLASEGAEPLTGLLRLVQRPRLQPAFTAMFEDYSKTWTMSELASLCLMSRSTFARQFGEAVGRSANDMLVEIRMMKASKQLAQTSNSISKIAQDTGYKSDAAFQRAFKNHIGMTPGKWRVQSRLLTTQSSETP
ncbi:AraC family transcriptional regulator [Pseudomonas agarici]|uniref:AraC family transcriptional regulator n=1 Tax=Pseudomonas agarici TaxID=46677 RepID=A0A0X1T7P2_PSEAA|nr:AraC family transcriptional regulator [Pseudomonas agarici]AMB88114.1 AraC family transcriptional regulator [Pseudomonas agarici]NWB93007.1 helix-turn-helix transcriptional regulator [Pseudomonas agarici]NWC09274.1 helix-turn-helix transcriptional regulator [Pseudomonas agarici]SEK29779.1 transcriptional regulator, AraC family [Pseudomonas agarici]